VSYAKDRHDQEAYLFAERFFGDEPFLTGVEYFGESRGELDAYGFIGDDLYIIEYKTRYTENSRKKAIKQLKRAKDAAGISGVMTHLIFAFEKNKYRELIL